LCIKRNDRFALKLVERQKASACVGYQSNTLYAMDRTEKLTMKPLAKRTNIMMTAEKK